MNEEWNSRTFFSIFSLGLGIPAPFLILTLLIAESGHDPHPGVALVVLWACIELIWTFVRVDKAVENPPTANQRKSFARGVLVMGSALGSLCLLPVLLSFDTPNFWVDHADGALLVPYGLAIFSSYLCRAALKNSPESVPTTEEPAPHP